MPTCPLVFFFLTLVHSLLVSPVSCSLHVYTSTLSLYPCFAAFSHYAMFTSYVRPGCSSCWPFSLFIACLVGCLLAIFVFDHQSRRPPGHHQSYLLLDLSSAFHFPWAPMDMSVLKDYSTEDGEHGLAASTAPTAFVLTLMVNMYSYRYPLIVVYPWMYVSFTYTGLQGRYWGGLACDLSCLL